MRTSSNKVAGKREEKEDEGRERRRRPPSFSRRLAAARVLGDTVWDNNSLVLARTSERRKARAGRVPRAG